MESKLSLGISKSLRVAINSYRVVSSLLVCVLVFGYVDDQFINTGNNEIGKYYNFSIFDFKLWNFDTFFKII